MLKKKSTIAPERLAIPAVHFANSLARSVSPSWVPIVFMVKNSSRLRSPTQHAADLPGLLSGRASSNANTDTLEVGSTEEPEGQTRRENLSITDSAKPTCLGLALAAAAVRCPAGPVFRRAPSCEPISSLLAEETVVRRLLGARWAETPLLPLHAVRHVVHAWTTKHCRQLLALFEILLLCLVVLVSTLSPCIATRLHRAVVVPRTEILIDKPHLLTAVHLELILPTSRGGSPRLVAALLILFVLQETRLWTGIVIPTSTSPRPVAPGSAPCPVILFPVWNNQSPLP